MDPVHKPDGRQVHQYVDRGNLFFQRGDLLAHDNIFEENPVSLSSSSYSFRGVAIIVTRCLASSSPS